MNKYIISSLIILAGTLYAGQILAAEYYVYKHQNGSTLYTDRKSVATDNYTLIATIGRPTAAVSCNNAKLHAASHQPIIKEYSAQYGVNKNLIKAIIAVESCFDKNAVSRVGAQGLMQLMPKTATSLGVYDAFNAKDNIKGGTRYFRQMLELFDFDVELALAAYNAGPNAVKKYNGIPPYKETQTYVKKVIKHYHQYKSLDS